VRPITPIKPSEAVVSRIKDRVFDALLAEPQAKECPHVGHGCHLERCCSGLSRCITVAGGTPTCMAPADVIKRCLARSRNDTCQELTLCAGLEEECTFSGCCAGRLRCFERDAYYAQCLRRCPHSKAWSCVERQAAKMEDDEEAEPMDLSDWLQQAPDIVRDAIDKTFGDDDKVKVAFFRFILLPSNTSSRSDPPAQVSEPLSCKLTHGPCVPVSSQMLAYGHVLGLLGASACLTFFCGVRCLCNARARARRRWQRVEAIRSVGNLADELKADPSRVVPRWCVQKARKYNSIFGTADESCSTAMTDDAGADASSELTLPAIHAAGQSSSRDASWIQRNS